MTLGPALGRRDTASARRLGGRQAEPESRLPAIGLGAMLLGIDAGLLRPRIQPWMLGALVILLLVQAVPVWDLHGPPLPVVEVALKKAVP